MRKTSSYFFEGDKITKICSINDCQKVLSAKGFCKKHYLYFWRKENPENVRLIQKRWGDSHKEQRKQYNTEYHRKYYQLHKEEKLQSQKQYRDEHREEYNEKNRKEYEKNKIERNCKRRKRYPEIKEKHQLREKGYRISQRIKGLHIISDGKMVCENCGIDEIPFLTVDHKNGLNELGHDRNMKGPKLIRYILNKCDNPRKYFQILCWNCNFLKSLHSHRNLSSSPKAVASRKRKSQIKLESFSMISQGTPKCNCCGYNELDGLTIDHRFGRDPSEKRITGEKLWSRILDLEDVNQFQVLCMNCNCAKGKLGHCPHKKMEIIRIE